MPRVLPDRIKLIVSFNEGNYNSKFLKEINSSFIFLKNSNVSKESILKHAAIKSSLVVKLLGREF